MGVFSQAEIESLLRQVEREALGSGGRGLRNIFTREEEAHFRLNGIAGTGQMRILGRGPAVFLRVTPG